MSDQEFRYPMSTARKDNMAPLVLSSNGHPAYQPVKLNIKTASDLKINKAKVPEKPLAPYMRYSKKVWDQVKAAYPDAKLWEIGRIIGQMWRDVSDSEKQEYLSEYENAKADYCEQLKAYHNSPQYQNFLSNASKKKSTAPNMIASTNVLSGNNILNQLNNNTIVNGSNNVVAKGSTNDPATTYSTSLSHYAIEPAEDDGIDDGQTSKHIASSRFTRNHRLLNEIFSEYCVQDNRSIVTMQRMEQLKKQVTSLELHQDKLKQELQLIEDKYENKKRKFLNSSKDFENEMNKMKEFKVSDEQKSEYYAKHYEQIQKQWKEYTDNFMISLSNRNVSKDVANNLLKDGLDNLINNNNKSLMSISNPSNVTIVALQQAVDTTANTNANNSTNTTNQPPGQPANPSSAVAPSNAQIPQSVSTSNINQTSAPTHPAAGTTTPTTVQHQPSSHSHHHHHLHHHQHHHQQQHQTTPLNSLPVNSSHSSNLPQAASDPQSQQYPNQSPMQQYSMNQPNSSLNIAQSQAHSYPNQGAALSQTNEMNHQYNGFQNQAAQHYQMNQQRPTMPYMTAQQPLQQPANVMVPRFPLNQMPATSGQQATQQAPLATQSPMGMNMNRPGLASTPNSTQPNYPGQQAFMMPPNHPSHYNPNAAQQIQQQQATQFRSTNTPPANLNNGAIISPNQPQIAANVQQQNQQSIIGQTGPQSAIINRIQQQQQQPTPSAQQSQQQTAQSQIPQQQQQIRHAGPVQPNMPSQPMPQQISQMNHPMHPNPNMNMNMNMNYYHQNQAMNPNQSQMPMNMYNMNMQNMQQSPQMQQHQQYMNSMNMAGIQQQQQAANMYPNQQQPSQFNASGQVINPQPNMMYPQQPSSNMMYNQQQSMMMMQPQYNNMYQQQQQQVAQQNPASMNNPHQVAAQQPQPSSSVPNQPQSNTPVAVQQPSQNSAPASQPAAQQAQQTNAEAKATKTKKRQKILKPLRQLQINLDFEYANKDI